jgi:ribosomal protein L37E
MKKICLVCGYDKLEQVPYDEYGYPTYVTCSCCGFEFGFDDSSKKMTFLEYREKWILKGFKFFNKSKQPKEWDENILKEQLKNTLLIDYKPRIPKP